MKASTMKSILIPCVPRRFSPASNPLCSAFEAAFGPVNFSIFEDMKTLIIIDAASATFGRFVRVKLDDDVLVWMRHADDINVETDAVILEIYENDSTDEVSFGWNRRISIAYDLIENDDDFSHCPERGVYRE